MDEPLSIQFFLYKSLLKFKLKILNKRLRNLIHLERVNMGKRPTLGVHINWAKRTRGGFRIFGGGGYSHPLTDSVFSNAAAYVFYRIKPRFIKRRV